MVTPKGISEAISGKDNCKQTAQICKNKFEWIEKNISSFNDILALSTTVLALHPLTFVIFPTEHPVKWVTDFSSLAFKKCTYFDIRLNWVEHLLLMVCFWAFYIFFYILFLLHISIILLSFTLIYNCLFKSMQFGHFLPLFLVSSKLESYIEFLVTNTKQEAELQNVSGICEA